MSEINFWEEFEKYYSDMPDCVSAGIDSYESVIKNIFDLTNGLLILNKFKGINNTGREYRLELIINNQNHIFEFIGSDYFDTNLLTEFNNIIENEYPDEKRQLVEFADGMTFDFAIAFIPKVKEYELAKSGKIWRNEDWIYQYEQKNL